MSINIIDNFSVNVAKPLDAKITASGSVARWAIPYRYDGLKVYDLSDRKTYVWNISSATWSIDHQIIIGDGYVPKYQPSLDGFTNSVLFSTASNIGINTTVPKSVLQINDPSGFAQPISLGFYGLDSRISYNWCNDGDQVYVQSKGSSILVFSDDHFTIKVRESNSATNSSSFTSPFSLSKRRLDIMTDVIGATGGTISMTGTNSVTLTTGSTGTINFVATGLSSSFNFITANLQRTLFGTYFHPSSPYGTFSITTNTSGYPSHIYMRSSDYLDRGTDFTLSAGNGTAFKFLYGEGGRFNISAGHGLGSGFGGSVSIVGGNGGIDGAPGDIYLIPGSNLDPLNGNVYLGINRVKVSDNDVFAWVHNKGTNGIGDSGNNVAPWGYPSLASGQFTLISGDVTSLVNCSSFTPRPCAWHRTGNIVTVSGQVSFSVTTANVDTSFKLKIPISSSFGVDSGGGDGNNWQLSGVGKIVSKYGSSGDVVTIQAYSTGMADFKFKPSSTGAQNMTYHYTYILGSWPNTSGGGGGGLGG
jgi:hypothetical protein